MEDEKSLNIYEDGQPKEFSPSTKSKTVIYKNKSLNDVLDDMIPVEITRAEYIAKVNSGEINENTTTYYRIIDDPTGLGINDGIVTESSTFSSKKILEMIATLGSGGTIILGNGTSSSGRARTVLIDLNPIKWEKNGDNPYTQTVVVEDLENPNVVSVSLSSKLNEVDFNSQYEELARASIRKVEHENNKLVFKAYGKKPEKHIIVEAIIQ